MTPNKETQTARLTALMRNINEGQGVELVDDHLIKCEPYPIAQQLGIAFATYTTRKGSKLIYRPRIVRTINGNDKPSIVDALKGLKRFEALKVSEFTSPSKRLSDWGNTVGVTLTVSRLGGNDVVGCRVE